MADICQQAFAVGCAQPFFHCFDGGSIDMPAAEVAQGLDDQTADPAGGGHVAWGGLLEGDLSLADLHHARPAVGEVDDFRRHLGGEPQEDGRIGSGRLQAGGVATGQRLGDVVDGRFEQPQLGIDFRVIVDAPGKLANQPGLLVALGGRGFGVTTATILE